MKKYFFSDKNTELYKKCLLATQNEPCMSLARMTYMIEDVGSV